MDGTLKTFCLRNHCVVFLLVLPETPRPKQATGSNGFGFEEARLETLLKNSREGGIRYASLSHTLVVEKRGPQRAMHSMACMRSNEREMRGLVFSSFFAFLLVSSYEPHSRI
ncbi:hypothetical protein PSPO01_00064 [Paraphaeosphaeria sporulosa]